MKPPTVVALVLWMLLHQRAVVLCTGIHLHFFSDNISKEIMENVNPFCLVTWCDYFGIFVPAALGFKSAVSFLADFPESPRL